MFSFLLLQVKYQDKDVIVQEGTEGNTFYIILKGEVRQCRMCTNAHRNVLLHRPACVFFVYMHSSPFPPFLLVCVCVYPSGPGD